MAAKSHSDSYMPRQKNHLSSLGPLSVMLGDKGMWFTRPVFAGRYGEYAEMFISRKNEA